MKTLTVVAASAAGISLLVSHADAHTIVKQPQAEFKKGTKYPSEWAAEFPPPWKGTFKTGAQYAAAAKEKGFKNLRAFLEDKGPDCGNSLPNAKPKPIPSDGLVKFTRALGHPGPCEVWLGDSLAFHNDDCMANLNTPESVKVDYSLCKGSCLLRFYWLGLQASGSRWQSYKNCVPLGGGGGKARSIDDEEPPVNVNEIDAEAFALEQKEEEELAARNNATNREEFGFADLSS